MEQLVHDGRGEPLNDPPLLGSQCCQPTHRLFDLDSLDVFRSLAQGDDRRRHLEGSHPLEDRTHLLLDQPLGLGRFATPSSTILLHTRFQVVNIEQERVVDVLDGWVNIPRDRNVDEKDRSVHATADCLLDIFSPDEVVRCPR